jgi:hypothetical protein
MKEGLEEGRNEEKKGESERGDGSKEEAAAKGQSCLKVDKSAQAILDNGSDRKVQIE